VASYLLPKDISGKENQKEAKEDEADRNSTEVRYLEVLLIYDSIGTEEYKSRACQ